MGKSMKKRICLGGAEVFVKDTPRYRQFWSWVNGGKWEPTTLGVIRRAATGTTYIDVGGWIGPTVIAGALVADRVLTYEPDALAAAELRANLHLNGLQNVEVREFALCDRTGTVGFGPGATDELGMSESSMVIGTATTTVPAVDALAEVGRSEFAKCGLLKIDVEGAEFDLIPRLSKYFRRSGKPVLLLSVHKVNWPTPAMFTRIAPLHRELVSIGKKARLFWTLRHYRFVHIDARDDFLDRRELWMPLTTVGRLRFVLSGTKAELLFSDTQAVACPLDEPAKHGTPLPQVG